jgi:hypothetical protein
VLLDDREDIKDLVILVNRIEDEPRSPNVRAVSTSIGSLLATDAPKNLFLGLNPPKPAQAGPSWIDASSSVVYNRSTDCER